MIPLNTNQYVLINLIIKYFDKNYVTLGHMQKFNKNDFEILLDVLYNILDHKAEDYKTEAISSFLFKYMIIPTDVDTVKKSIFNKDLKTVKIPHFNFFGYNLPTTANYTVWGDIYLQKGNIIWISKPNSNTNYKIEKFEN